MARKLAFLGVIGALALVAVLVGGQIHRAQAQPPQLERFNVDITECLNQAGVPADPALSGGVGGINCVQPEPAGIGQVNVDEPLDVAVPAGDRLGIPFYYSGPGWKHLSDAQIPDGTLVGDVISKTDLLNDGVVDILASPSGATTPESFYDRPAVGTTTSGTCGASTDESWLSSALPGAAAMAPWSRQLACLTTLWLGGVTKFTITPMSLNSVTLVPQWTQPGWAGVAGITPMRATTVLLGGDPNAPSVAFYTPRMAPQDSLSHTFGNAVGNPPAGSPVGIYARWATELSDADFSNGAKTLTLTTSCKVIGPPGTTIADTDSDCLANSAGAAGVPYEGEAISSMEGADCPGGTGSSVTSAALWDSDGDGLPDGVEVAWGSNPCLADTDGDSRSDLEEMIGPSEFLTNPTVQDTDGDTVLDGGWKVDGPDAGLAPDCLDLNGDGTCGDGRQVQVSGLNTDPACANPAVAFPCYINGSTHTRVAFDIVGTDIKHDTIASGGRDNCPSIANPTQVNTDLDTATQLGNGDLTGNACDADDDQDGIPDVAELAFKWNTTTKSCTTVTSGGTPLNPLDADTDNDGILDGIECDMGSNPNNATDVPLPCSAGPLGARPDLDGDLLCGTANAGLQIDNEEVNWDTDDLSNVDGSVMRPDPDADSLVGDADADSDGDTLKDGCEVLVAGTMPMNPDTDGDTVADNAEVVGPTAGAPGNAACQGASGILSIEYAGIGSFKYVVAGGASVPVTDTTVPDSKGGSAIGGGRTADTDKDGLLNYQDPDPAGGLLANMDYTYDDNHNGNPCIPLGSDAADDGPSWDANCNGILDGQETGSPPVCKFTAPATQDTDGDGLMDNWEVCKWGTNPNLVDSDSDGTGDCIEAVDTDGNGVVDFGGDALNSARATLQPAGLTAGKFGKDGDFDLNGNNVIVGDFGKDTLTTAKIALHLLPCK